MQIYVLERPDGLCKIGRSNDPTKRVRGLATQGGFDISRAWMSLPDVFDFAAETRVHQSLHTHRTIGEWFDVDFESAVKCAIDSLHTNQDNEIVPCDCPQDVQHQLGRGINLLRKLKGVTQKEMSQATGIEAGNLNRIILGSQWPSHERLDILAAYFGVRPSELFRIGEQGYIDELN